ncbi:hypothetical protein [Anatilimnocola floriformis]|uniref:hypothetical protein n=1 Tax=Anatilimnocola floriformis TaxID=2948575 RepID=UPI0020C365EC|nr:hypothetical protein [Anatilimnocola floriformis]
MNIQLTDDQWASIKQDGNYPVHVSVPVDQAAFVLLPADVYERFKSLFEADPPSAQERQQHLQQFGRRAGWDDPAMNIYDDLDPRSKS